MLRLRIEFLIVDSYSKECCDCSKRNETKDTVRLGQLLYEVYLEIHPLLPWSWFQVMGTAYSTAKGAAETLKINMVSILIVRQNTFT